MGKPIKLAYLVSHPIQYQAPLLRHIARDPAFDLTVLFGSDFSVRGYQDRGFGVNVEWDVPLLEGYRHRFLPRLRDASDVGVLAPLNRGLLRALQQGPDGKGFDVLWVHGYATANALHGMVAAKALGLPVLLRAESWLRDRPRSQARLAAKHGFFSLLRGLVNGVLPIGSLSAEYWSYYLGETVPQFLMPYAVDNAYFQRRSIDARSGRAALAAELGVDPARPVILFASKLQRRKRCQDLLDAYTRLLAEHPAVQPYLVIVGDGEERARLEQVTRERGLADVRFAGFRNQSALPGFFDLATVFVLPSEHEPWGLIVNEVMNAGRAIIVSSDVGSQPDLITHGVEGLVYPVGDIAALTRALAEAVVSPKRAREMGEQALQRIATWSFEADIDGLRSAVSAVTRGTRA